MERMKKHSTRNNFYNQNNKPNRKYLSRNKFDPLNQTGRKHSPKLIVIQAETTDIVLKEGG